MSESITKIGAAAQVAGVSLEQLEGMTGAVTQSTGLMGSEVGTALNIRGIAA